MNNMLLINASPWGSASHANRLALELMATLRHRHPHAELTERDLGSHPLPPLGPNYAQALTSATALEDPVFDVSEILIRELEACDLLMIATPLHNFMLPAALKLWIDYVLRIQRTFSSGPEGKTGLLKDRPVYVLVSSGGFHHGDRARQPDFLTPYLRVVLNTLGLFDTHFTYLQGLASGDDAIRHTLEQARERLALQPLFANLACA